MWINELWTVFHEQISMIQQLTSKQLYVIWGKKWQAKKARKNLHFNKVHTNDSQY